MTQIKKPKSVLYPNGIKFNFIEFLYPNYQKNQRVYSNKHGWGIITINSKTLIVVDFEDYTIKYDTEYFINLSHKEYTETQNKIRKFFFNLKKFFK
jgi:hypothetical protein